MKAVVISDSHGDRDTVRNIIEKEKPEIVIHLGDHANDVDLTCMPPEVRVVYRVNGNCDFSDFPEVICQGIEGHSFLIMHGHTRGVKMGISRALSTAKTRGATVLLYGHTHVSDISRKDGVLIVNPGSAKKHGFGSFKRATYALLKFHEDTILASIEAAP